MKREDFLCLARRELHGLLATIERKNHDYTGADDDALANFKVTEAIGLADARIGVLIRMVDKIQRLRTYCAKGKLEVVGEGAKDACLDICGYAILLLAMLEEQGEPYERP